jgi:Cu-processing system permease protein
MVIDSSELEKKSATRRDVIEKLKNDFWGAMVVAEREFYTNLTTVRMFIIVALFGFCMLFYSYYNIEYMTSLTTQKTPDNVLASTALFIVVAIGPLLAVILSFDSITKEKAGKSLDLLLCRPLSRRAVAFGKFFGVITALALPVISITLLDILCISSLMNWRLPSLTMFIGFIAFTILLMSTYALLQLTISTIAKTSGTAILAGGGLWLFFNFLWSLVIYIAYIVRGSTQQSPIDDPLSTLFFLIARGEFNDIMLFNPGGVFGGAYNLGIDTLTGSVPANIPACPLLLAIIMWFVLSLIVAIEVFNRMANA